MSCGEVATSWADVALVATILGLPVLLLGFIVWLAVKS